MSVLGQPVSARLVGMLAGLILLVAALIPAVSGTPTRDVTLVARGMAFYLEGDLKTPNPIIDVRAGERVRVVLRNQDRGMTHDFAVPALGVALTPIAWKVSGDLVVDVPSEPGTYEYVCRPHSLMMRGVIRVVPAHP